ncbi:lamin tail domain-containing protein [Vibrio sp. SS-MA-C1-2]|uniref:lamin tail domain-containing protein n=1 Tax=Vibrio sp. SS-MA-C1-2 TaxID=2908646 RepID=UPI001F36F400|nr:lamin tail domain-containing protein [Vibrio sp. SS-MA-C1-2]UJF18608.1 lamin tail domain-containing protein [Vibrio sp. SS-MA-C1-2]
MIRCLFLFFSLLCSFSINAFQVEIEDPIYSSVNDKQMAVSIINSGDETIALQVKVFERTFNQAGVEDYSKPYPLVTAFPQNIIVSPNSTELVTLVWNSNKMPKTEVPLRVVAKQVPIQFNSGDAPALNVMFAMVKSIYIRPENAKANIKLDSFKWQEKKQQLTLTVDNKGNRGIIADRIILDIDGKEALISTFTDDENSVGLMNRPNLLAGEVRDISVNIDSNQFKTINKITIKKVIQVQ